MGSRIPVRTPAGTYEVWVKRVGDNPRVRVLLHGGPGSTHEYPEVFEDFLPAAGIEFFLYDQLGSGRSDRPGDPSLWELDRYVDEVEQVRQALGLDRDTFVLYGQSWGGILYTDLLMEHHYVHHVLRMPPREWPEPMRRGFEHINPEIYVSMQGPSELGISADAKLAHWDRADRLAEIDVPALVIGAQHDTMDPGHMRMMADRLPQGRYLHCPDGSHLAMYDDQQVYFTGLVGFLKDLAR